MKIILTTLSGLVSNIRNIASLVVFVFVLSISISYASQSDTAVVLVTGSKSDITSISIIEVRRLYLGLPPVSNREAGKAVINMTDSDIFNVFLKNIMHMTEYRYRRRLVKRVFRYGSSQIKEVNSIEELSDHFASNKNDIAFVKVSSLDRLDNIKVLTRLW
ncbi:MAG: hypothetical protein IME93_06295 [Proteobacteria bacterium]|nr:hypothetical protein [Pseudomonadota bacterium]